MLGILDSKNREVTVVGAGIAGLLMADALDRQGYVVTLFEASNRAGGLIATHATPQGKSEAAAHSLQATVTVREACEDLGVELEPVRPESRARFIWRAGRLRKFPLSIWEALRAFMRAYFALADRRVAPEDMTLEQWARRFLGEAPLKYLMTPFVRGIYGARPSEINVSMAFPALSIPKGHSLLSFQLRKLIRGLLKRERKAKVPRPEMAAPKGGMGALTGALERRLKLKLGDRFKLNSPLRMLPNVPNLVLCVPAPAAAELLAGTDPALASALRGVRYSPLVSVTAFVEKISFKSPPQGVGVLLPEGTSRKSLGILFNSSSFSGRVADEERTMSFTLMMGGSGQPEVLDATDEEIRAAVRSDLESVLDLLPGAKIETVIHRWSRAVPQYSEKLRVAWEAAAQGWCAKPGHVLFGNYTGQVSVRGMIESSRAVQ